MKYLCLCVFILLCAACRPSDFELTMESYRAGEYDAAFKEFLALAGADHAEAQAMVGLMYEKGQGVEQDFAKAAEWHLKAAAEGIADAQIRIAQLYVKGQGVPA